MGADALAEVFQDLPVKQSPPIVRKMPLWSKWGLMTYLLLLLTAEWLWRRGVGLAWIDWSLTRGGRR